MTRVLTLQKLISTRHSLLTTKITVLVTGVFDILHQEHKKLLKKAKTKGDVLIVGLEPDQRVAKLKGTDRPKNPLSNRINNLVALNVADYIFELPSNLDTKQAREALIKSLTPHVLAVSSSTPNLGEKKRIMQMIGGTVDIVLSHNPKVSTSKILEDLK